MELTTENLDKIHRTLTISHNSAIATLKNIDFEAEPQPSPKNR